MAGISFVGLERITNNVQVTGSMSVDGAIQEKGYAIPTLIEKMVVRAEGSDGSTDITLLNFIPVTNEDGEVVVIA